jgi:membrane associated rhomboid family serine protease
MLYILVALVLVVVRITEATFGFRRVTSKWGDFSGAALLDGYVWTPITSSLLHNSLVHTLKQVILLLLIGQSAEQALGSSTICAYFLGGAFGCIVSWRMLRARLLADPDYPTNTAEEAKNVAFLADNCPSRGASACTYTIAVLAVIACGGSHCDLGNFGIGQGLMARWVVIMSGLLPETLAVAHEDRNMHLPWCAYVLMVAFVGNALVPVSPTVSDTVLTWWSVIIANHYARQYVSPRNKMHAGVVDWQSHLIGAFCGGLWGLPYAMSAGVSDESTNCLKAVLALAVCACAAVLGGPIG